MRIRLSATGLAAVLALGAATAQAEGIGVYVGGGLAQTKAPDLENNVCSQLNGFLDPGFSCNIEDSKTGFKLFGGAQFNDYVAAEASLVYLGNFDGSVNGAISGSPTHLSFRYDVGGISGDVVGTWPITNAVSLFARAGGFYWDIQDVWDVDHTGISFDYGVGIEYKFTKNMGLRAEFVEYKDVGDNEIGKTDLNAASLGLTYRIR